MWQAGKSFLVKMRDEKLEKSCKLGMVDYYSGDFVGEPRQTRYGFPGGSGACLISKRFGMMPSTQTASTKVVCMHIYCHQYMESLTFLQTDAPQYGLLRSSFTVHQQARSVQSLIRTSAIQQHRSSAIAEIVINNTN